MPLSGAGSPMGFGSLLPQIRAILEQQAATNPLLAQTVGRLAVDSPIWAQLAAGVAPGTLPFDPGVATSAEEMGRASAAGAGFDPRGRPSVVDMRLARYGGGGFGGGVDTGIALGEEPALDAATVVNVPQLPGRAASAPGGTAAAGPGQVQRPSAPPGVRYYGYETGIGEHAYLADPAAIVAAIGAAEDVPSYGNMHLAAKYARYPGDPQAHRRVPRAEGRAATAKLVHYYYRQWVDRGRPGDFLEFLHGRYAPVGARNDPTDLNQHWLKNALANLPLSIRLAGVYGGPGAREAQQAIADVRNAQRSSGLPMQYRGR